MPKKSKNAQAKSPTFAFRLDPERRVKLEEIAKLESRTLTNMLERMIDLYYDAYREKKQ